MKVYTEEIKNHKNDQIFMFRHHTNFKTKSNELTNTPK